MTEEQYYAQVKKLGLTPSNVPTVFIGSDGTTYNVPSPSSRTSEQRAEMIERLKANLGVSQRSN